MISKIIAESEFVADPDRRGKFMNKYDSQMTGLARREVYNNLKPEGKTGKVILYSTI